MSERATLFGLAWKSLLNRRLTAGLLVASVAMSVMLLVAVDRIRTETKTSFINTISGVDLVVGARGGPLNLLLYAVFRVGDATSNISWESYQLVAARPEVAWSVPLSLGDAHRGYRVLGTTDDYFVHYRYGRDRALAFETGKPFANAQEAVLGAEVAATLGYALGDGIVVSHGIGDVSFVHHDDAPFTVAGILAYTGTPVDRTVHVSLAGIEAMHSEPGEHDHGHDEHPGDEDDHRDEHVDGDHDEHHADHDDGDEHHDAREHAEHHDDAGHREGGDHDEHHDDDAEHQHSDHDEHVNDHAEHNDGDHDEHGDHDGHRDGEHDEQHDGHGADDNHTEHDEHEDHAADHAEHHGSGHDEHRDHDERDGEHDGELDEHAADADHDDHAGDADHADHASTHDEHEDHHADDHGDVAERQPDAITAFLVGMHSRPLALRLQRFVNEYDGEPLMAILPGATLQQLWDLVGVVETALISVAVLVVAAGLIGMTTTLLAGLAERRREMAVLRAVGAGPGWVFALLIVESAMLAATAAIAGVAAAHGAMFAGRAVLEDRFGLALAGEAPGLFDLAVVLGVTLAGALAATFPAWRAYRYSLADGLTMRV